MKEHTYQESDHNKEAAPHSLFFPGIASATPLPLNSCGPARKQADGGEHPCPHLPPHQDLPRHQHGQGGAKQRQPGSVNGAKDAGAEEILPAPLRDEFQQPFGFTHLCGVGLSHDIRVPYSLLLLVLPPIFLLCVRRPGFRGFVPTGSAAFSILGHASTPSPCLQDLPPDVTLAREEELLEGEGGAEDREQDQGHPTPGNRHPLLIRMFSLTPSFRLSSSTWSSMWRIS